MAPEVVLSYEEGGSYSKKCDIWSLGISVIEMIERIPPLFELHPMHALLKIRRSNPPTLKDETMWPRSLADFISQCLRRDPNDRPDALNLLGHEFMLQHPESEDKDAILGLLKELGISAAPDKLGENGTNAQRKQLKFPVLSIDASQMGTSTHDQNETHTTIFAAGRSPISPAGIGPAVYSSTSAMSGKLKSTYDTNLLSATTYNSKTVAQKVRSCTLPKQDSVTSLESTTNRFESPVSLTSQYRKDTSKTSKMGVSDVNIAYDKKGHVHRRNMSTKSLYNDTASFRNDIFGGFGIGSDSNYIGRGTGVFCVSPHEEMPKVGASTVRIMPFSFRNVDTYS